ncbi:MAG: hypothetical protein IT443_13585 [Phycisphaeraceae bacterium]|nr:hypothetical protein [Phycisphaeraceae bacterium]
MRRFMAVFAWFLKGRLGQRLLLAVLGLVSVGVVGLGILNYLWNCEPAFWQETRTRLESVSIAQHHQRAVGLEQHLLAAAGNGPAGEVLSITQDEVNGWLRTRLSRWLKHLQEENQPIAELEKMSDPVVIFEEGRVVVAFEVRQGTAKLVMAAYLDLTCEPEGLLRVNLQHVTVGRLQIPAVMVRHHLRAEPWLHTPATQWLYELLTQNRPLQLWYPPWEEGQSQARQVTDLRISPQRVDLTLSDPKP